MKKTALIILSAILFVMAGCNKAADPTTPSPTATPVTIITESFQVGVAGYTGCIETSVNDVNQTYNYGTADSLFVGVHGAGYQIDRTLMKFDLSGINSAAVVTSAELELTLNNNPYGLTMNAYALTKAWTEGTSVGGAYGADCTWIEATTGVSWGTPGGDFNELAVKGSKYFNGVPTNTTVTYQLDASMVSGWINNPSANNGFILKSSAEPEEAMFLVLYTSENATVLYRPKLTVQYYIP